MRVVLTACIVILILSTINVHDAEGFIPPTIQETQTEEAERLWELAIAAKGGRERLYEVKSFQYSLREKMWYGFKRINWIQEALYVFPSKFWEWDDQRGSVFGLGIEVYNQEKGLYLSYWDEGEGHKLLTRHKAVDSRRLYDVQLLYFMETRWVKPIPFNVVKGKARGRQVDIVQVRVKGYPYGPVEIEKLGYAIDPKSQLPIQMIYYWHKEGKEMTAPVDLSDYVDVSGIKIPQKVSGAKRKYQINVEYNERVFGQPPNVEAGIEAWKK
jgi:hypothetical protein